jgi:hypothetical protein
MRDHFTKRTQEHVNRVQGNARLLAQGFPYLKRELISQVNLHDDSKYQEPEVTPYIHITWKYHMEKQGKTYDPPADISP